LDDHAYILYTSGTTGRPKGVLGSHRQVLQFASDDIRQAHIYPEDRIGMAASLCLSASLTKIFPALLSGALLCPYDLKKRGVEPLAGWLTETGITIFACVPTVFRHLCAMLRPGQTIPSLRVIRLGGDRVNRPDVELYRTHFGRHCLLWVGYGATEAKLVTSLWLNHDSELPDGPLPVGYPALETEVLVLDPEGRPVEAGEVGQIAVKSRYLSPGYWRLPEQTRQKFLLASELLDEPEIRVTRGGLVRVYMTGDLGRKAEDGCLWHLGRVDFQVKIRGYRIEIDEIEAALMDLLGVRQAVVMAWQRARSVEPQLVAYVVPQEEPGPTLTDLRRALGDVLPEYMIPAIFVTLDEMPLDVHLKIDRQALPEPETSRPVLENEYVAPRDELERELAQIWEMVLGIEPVGVLDNFFDLGGHSLLAVRLFARIAERWGRELPLLTLLQAPTVEKLAELLRREAEEQARSLLVPIQPGGTRLPFFCIIPPASSAVGLAGLASHLGLDQPVYGLQYHRLRALDETQAETVTCTMPRVEELAQLYIQAVRKVRPEGPYALGGHGFGGTIAFEMAQQLLAEGQRVELLALIGSAPPTFKRPKTHLIGRMVYHRRRGRLLAVLLSYLPVKVARARSRLRWRVQQLIDRSAPGNAGGAGARYIPRVYAGRVTVFETTEALREAWAELAAAGVEYHVIEGAHNDMLREPLVGELAAQLRASLDRALERAAAAV
jgi:thioesterase domain-containing protein